MKRFAFYLSVSLLTHLIGFSAVWLANFLPTVISLPQYVPEVTEELEITTPVNFKTTKSDWPNFNNTKSNIITPTVEIRHDNKWLLEGIEPTMRGCGNGYGQGYKLPDGMKLGEGNSCFSSYNEANKEMKSWLQKADQIIERVVPDKQKDRLKSERVVAWFPEDEYRNRWVRIMWVHGQCIHWISAPALEYAVELERSKYNPYKFQD